MFNFTQDEYVLFTSGEVTGLGQIVGCSTIEMPVIGRMYIVKVFKSYPSLPTTEYPFNTISVPEIHLEKLS